MTFELAIITIIIIMSKKFQLIKIIFRRVIANKYNKNNKTISMEKCLFLNFKLLINHH